MVRYPCMFICRMTFMEVVIIVIVIINIVIFAIDNDNVNAIIILK